MNPNPRIPIQPLKFHPHLLPKLWGGSRLATLFHKPLPPNTPIGESWELADLPEHESRVRSDDPDLDGRALAQLLADWGDDLRGGARLFDGRFPLLVKFLDADQPLSVQVHPKPPADPTRAYAVGVKHEAWYIVHAEPGAELYIGLKPGVTPEDVQRAANTPAIRDLICTRPVQRGECYNLPSGVLHALGAGIVVAEVQTPSDVTYRIYDWDRVDDTGRARTLHIEQALANIRYDVADSDILQPTRVLTSGPLRRVQLCRSAGFGMDELRAESGEHPVGFPDHMPKIWVVVAGRGELVGDGFRVSVAAGDTLLIPAGIEVATVRAADSLTVLAATPC